MANLAWIAAHVLLMQQILMGIAAHVMLDTLDRIAKLSVSYLFANWTWKYMLYRCKLLKKCFYTQQKTAKYNKFHFLMSKTFWKLYTFMSLPLNVDELNDLNDLNDIFHI